MSEAAVIWPDDRPPPGGFSGPLLAGWWCSPDTCGDLRVLPNPWEAEAVADAERRVWGAAQELVVVASGALGGDESWWRWVLLPYLIHVLSAVEDAATFLRAAAHAEPGAHVLSFAPAPPPWTMDEGIARLRLHEHTRSLVSRVADELALPLRPVCEDGGHSDGALANAPPSRGPRALAVTTLRVLLERPARSRVVVIAPTGLTPGDALALRARTGARVIMRPGTTAPWGSDLAARDRLRAAGVAGDDLTALGSRLLADLLPRSVVEGARHLPAVARRAYGAPAHVLAGNYAADELMNAYLAECAAAGRRIDHVQHGGFYLQARVNPQERLEMREDSAFLGWPTTPHPQLERLRGGHRRGDDIVIVEGLNPPDRHVLRFASMPMGDQGDESAKLLGRFAASVGSARERLRLRRSMSALPAWRPAELEALPHALPRGAHSAMGWLRHARMAVITYPDTPLVEAMVLGVPLIGLWNPRHWEVRDDVADVFDVLFAAGVFFSDPVAAAARVDDVHERADEWWASGDVAAARDAFIARFAPPGDWLAAWSAHLRAMRAP